MAASGEDRAQHPGMAFYRITRRRSRSADGGEQPLCLGDVGHPQHERGSGDGGSVCPVGIDSAQPLRQPRRQRTGLAQLPGEQGDLGLQLEQVVFWRAEIAGLAGQQLGGAPGTALQRRMSGSEQRLDPLPIVDGELDHTLEADDGARPRPTPAALVRSGDQVVGELPVRPGRRRSAVPDLRRLVGVERLGDPSVHRPARPWRCRPVHRRAGQRVDEAEAAPTEFDQAELFGGEQLLGEQRVHVVELVLHAERGEDQHRRGRLGRQLPGDRGEPGLELGPGRQRIRQWCDTGSLGVAQSGDDPGQQQRMALGVGADCAGDVRVEPGVDEHRDRVAVGEGAELDRPRQPQPLVLPALAGDQRHRGSGEPPTDEGEHLL